jgi:hypothetical protein
MKRIDPLFPNLVTLSLVFLGWTAQASVPQAFLYSTAGRGIQDGSLSADKCTLMIRKSFVAYDSCVTAAQDGNRGKGGDPRYFDTGLFFSAWVQMDMNVRPDWPSKTGEDKQRLADAKPLAIKYLKLYRETQKKAAVTDEQVIVVTGLNPEQFQTKLKAADHGY